MMKIKFFALAALALALTACNNDNEILNGDPVAAQFTADIAIATRASGTTWDNGDRIGITDIGNDTQYGNVPFILKNGSHHAAEVHHHFTVEYDVVPRSLGLLHQLCHYLQQDFPA